MIAQLSQSEPFGSPSASSSGGRSAGSFARNSGVDFLPQTSISSKSRSAARMKMRTVRLLTLGLRMLSVCVATIPPSVRVLGRAIVRERRLRACDEPLDGVREVDAVDVGVVALDAK